MKKLITSIFILSSIVLFFIYNNVYASTWTFKWENTDVDIEVNTNISLYKDIPKAYLYKDGVLLDDAYVTYNKEGDWLYFLDDVDTQTLGTYHVWYKAYENMKYNPGTCNGYKCLITFNVVDTISPKINILNESVSIRRNEMFDLYSNFVISDNYTNIFDESNVFIDTDYKYDEVGSYTVNVKAFDYSKNTVTASYKINVFDTSIPKINFLGSGDMITVGLYQDLDIKSYFEAIDEIDGDLSSSIIYPYYDTQDLGSYYYTVSVKNKALNECEYTIIINVVDDTPPIITLTKNTIILDYKTDFESFDFKKYILKIEDNISIDYSNLRIVDNLENLVGSYYVNYIYNDGVYQSLATLDVRLVSKTKPIIDYEPIKIKEGNYIDLYNYVTVYDESDENVYETLVIDDKAVDYKNEGTYFAEAYAINSSGLSTVKKIKVEVVEDDELSTPVIIILTITFSLLSVLLIGFGVFLFLKMKKNKKENSV